MSAQGWGAPETHSLRGGEPAGPFSTVGLRAALEVDGSIPNGQSLVGNPSKGNVANGNTKRETPKTADGWVPPTPYDYEALGGEAAHEWESNAAIYEWDGEEGDIGPEHPALEKELFGEPGNRVVQGIDFSK